MDRAPAPSPAAPRTRAAAARALVIWGVASASACALNQQGVTPPADTFFYPASAVVDPSGRWLFVSNSNADLRFNDGTLVVVDLDLVSQDRLPSQAWSPCPQEDYVNPLPRSDPQICCWDRLDPNILNCDERRYVQADATVRIGSFAAGMIWQPYCPDACNMPDPSATPPVLGCSPDDSAGRLFIGVRGDTSLTWLDVDNLPSAPKFHCGQTGGSLAECSADHRLTEAMSALSTEAMDPGAPMVNLPDEPYALELDPYRGLLYVGHLVGNTSTTDSGGISLFNVSGTSPKQNSDGSFPPRADPSYIAPFPSVFPPNSAGFFGITALKRHVPLGQPQLVSDGLARDEIFASSRYLPLVTSIVPFVPFGSNPPSSCPPNSNSDLVVEGAADSLNSGLVGSEMRGVEIIDPSDPTVAAQRAYALQRVPPALVGFTIATNNAGAVITTPTDVSETCSSPTFLYQHQVAGEGPRLYVNCFDTGEIYVFDPSVPTLLTSFQVGRGPAGLVFPSSPIVTATGKVEDLAYLIGFSDNNISVLDLTHGSPTQYHVIQRLGFPTVTPR
jgi:hypothetical protein